MCNIEFVGLNGWVDMKRKAGLHVALLFLYQEDFK